MENYKLAQRLGKGAQGSVYLVESNENGKKYVLKKMECKDEAEANKAFKEAMALQELAHPYICGYREFFVTWDREEGALFVCIVMDYYPLGDLEMCVRKKRENKEKFDELILKKWIGQMLDAITFVHEKGVIHRDLKPSNIFLKSDLDISVGDFGVATVMGDARTKTRTMVGSMNWMAPEVLERPYDERSDCWSMGCIILEMATTATHDANQIAEVLVQIKHSPQVLEEALKLVGEQYESEICGVIRTMLRRNFKQRPTALELKEMQYVQHCMALSKAKPGDHGQSNGSDEYEPVPKGGSVDALFAYIDKYQLVEGAVVESLDHLTEITRDEKVDFSDKQKQLISMVMGHHMGEKKVLIPAIEFLQNLVVTITPDDVLVKTPSISRVLHAMRNHSNSAHLQAVATALLMAMAADEDAGRIIGEEGGVQDVLAALRAYPKDPVICSNCCGALWILAVCDNNTAILTEECGLMDICSAMRTHKDIEELVENACSALWSLSMEDENIEIMNEQNVIGMLVDAIKQHTNAPKVIKNACTTIGGIIYAEEECGLRLLSDPQSIPAILEAFKKHAKHPEVVEAMCELMLTMTETEELAAELASYPVFNLLTQAIADFPSIEDITQKAKQAIEALQKVKGV